MERKVTSYNVSTSAQEQVKIKPDTATSDKFSFLVNGTALPAETVIDYIPVTFSLNASNGGAPIYAWYAKTTDAANNLYRNVMLKMETSVPYNIGTFTYQLTSAVFAK
jgi:enoyl reductase-like protein